tara:strand:+ start:194 stop:604 length:411 start_codon:yes stop_codon:yes gene_type:complete
VLRYIATEVRRKAISDPVLYSKIATRFYPQQIDLVTNPTYPIIAFSFIGGFPDADNFAFDSFIFECSYISEKSLDQAIEIYNLFRGLINKEHFKNSAAGKYFQVFEDSKPIDATEEIGDRLLYTISNTWEVRAIGG